MPAVLFEPPTLDRRRYCECCGCPTLFVPDAVDGGPDWQSSGTGCDLCEWDNSTLDANGELVSLPDGERNDGLTLEQARTNFARFGSIYDSEHLPEWKVSPPSEAVQLARRQLRDAYEAIKSADAAGLWSYWVAVTNAEGALREALNAQQTEDELLASQRWEESDS